MKRKIGFQKRRQRKRRTYKKDIKKGFSLQKIKPRIQMDTLKNVSQWILQILIVVIIATVIVIYFGQRVSNLGESMNPVLNNGDVVLTNRIIYDASKPKRGDVIAFKPNGNENASYRIKRIIGLPGETVQIKDGVIYIDGKQLKEDYEATAIDDVGIAGEEMKLAGDEYFVLGDNRSAGDDSRQANIGNVKRSEIYGKVWFVIKSKNSNFGFVK